MIHLMSLEAHTRSARCKQRLRNLLSGLRGRFHRYTAIAKPCVMTDPNGTVHMSTYAKIPVTQIMSNITKLVAATMRLQECEASWLALHRAGVFSCQSSWEAFTLPGSDTGTHTTQPPDDQTQTQRQRRTLTLGVAEALPMLRIHDAHSLHQYLARMRRCPLGTCCDAVCLLEGVAWEGREGWEHHSSASSVPPSATATATEARAGAMSLQPVQLWQEWIQTLCQVVEDARFVRIIRKELVELQLMGTGACGSGLGSNSEPLHGSDGSDDSAGTDSFVSDWLEEQEQEEGGEEEGGGGGGGIRGAEAFVQQQEDGWFCAADRVFREVLETITTGISTTASATTVTTVSHCHYHNCHYCYYCHCHDHHSCCYFAHVFYFTYRNTWPMNMPRKTPKFVKPSCTIYTLFTNSSQSKQPSLPPGLMLVLLALHLEQTTTGTEKSPRRLVRGSTPPPCPCCAWT
jgi:hypothetical protein